MDQSEQRGEWVDWQEEPPPKRRRGWIASGALVGTGLLAGAILAGPLSANAASGGGGSSVLAVPAAASSPDTPASDPDSGRGWRGWGHGDHEAQVSDDDAARVEDAVLATYPGATIWWVRSDSDGGYDAYLETTDDEHLAVHLDDTFAIAGTDDLPDADGRGRDGHGWAGRGWAGHGWDGHGWDGTCADGSAASISDGDAAKVEDAVLAAYPGATIWWVRADSDGGYDAYLETADDEHLAVHLDDAFAITGTDDLPDRRDHGGTAVSDETAAQVEDAVLAQYPGATVPWIRADSDDGGYHALVRTADDTRVIVTLDGSFAITGTEALPSC